MTSKIGLQELLQKVREELLAAERSVPTGEAMFHVENVELELTVVTASEAGGGIKVYVVELGGKYQKEKTHTVRIKLAPIRDIIAAEP